MLAADSKVVVAHSTDPLDSEVAYSWKQIVEPVEPFLEAVHSRLAKQVTEFDPASLTRMCSAPGISRTISSLCSGGVSMSWKPLITTVSTPHRGTRVADAALSAGEAVQRAKARFAAAGPRSLPVGAMRSPCFSAIAFSPRR